MFLIMEVFQILANAATSSFWNFAIAFIVIAICAKFIVDLVKYVMIFLGFVASLFVSDFRIILANYLITTFFPNIEDSSVQTKFQEMIKNQSENQSEESTDNQ